MKRILLRWREAPWNDRLTFSMLTIAMVGYLGHYLTYSNPWVSWFIEDAAITFAYAQNLIDGEGLVPFAGGERVEGYSNPTWMLLMAAGGLLGVDPWVASKVTGAVLGMATLPCVWALTRRALGPDTTAPWAALVGPVLLAASPQFVIWNTSGLENSLFCFLLALGMLRLAQEGTDHHRWPWSAVLFLLLSATRPEGTMYAALGWVSMVMFNAPQRRWGRIVGWTLLWVVPFAAYNAWRLHYFAWPFPNTYYAKLGKGDRFQPFNWTGRGWKYIWNFVRDMKLGAALPLLGLATLGFRRRTTVALSLALVAVVISWKGNATASYQDLRELIGVLPDITFPDVFQTIRKAWSKVRTWTLLGSALIAGLITLRGVGGKTRGLMWAVFCSSVFYPLYVGGDWMKAFRWMNPVTITLFPLMGLGLGRLVDSLVRTDGRALARRPLAVTVLGVAGMLTLGVVGGIESNRFWKKPETTTKDIQKRVRYMKGVQKKLHVDHVTLLDVDMGAHMMYTDWRLLDTAGLIDVPIARHPHYARAFLKDYIFEEERPEFVHIHGGWARTTKINQQREFRNAYLEIPGYPAGGKAMHVGNHIRRDLLATPMDDRPDLVTFGDIELEHFEVPAGLVAQGTTLDIRTEWRTRASPGPFRVLLFLHDGKQATAVTAFEPGLGWLPPDEWKPDEAIVAWFELPIPKHTPRSSYQLGMVLVDVESGELIPATDEGPVVFAPGNALMDQSIEVSDWGQAKAAQEQALARHRSLADQGSCDNAWSAWKQAQYHANTSVGAQDVAHTLMARCWAKVAQSSEGRAQIEALLEARHFNHRNPEMLALALPLAETRHLDGERLADNNDVEEAYIAFRDAVRLDPQRASSRRRAEETRNLRLGL